MTQEVLKLALEALNCAKVTASTPGNFLFFEEAIAAIKEALAHPQQEPVAWVGLTQEQIQSCYGGEIDDFARAIEAKLKEKNDQP